MAWYDSILDFGKTYGKDIVSVGTGAYDIYNAVQRQGTTQDALQPGGITDPFGAQRGQYQQKLSQLYNDPSSLANLPGYAFAQEQGERGVNRAAAKSGHFQSPNRIQNLMKFNQGLAGQFYNQEATRLARLAGSGIQPNAGAVGGLLQQQQLAGQNVGAGGTDIWNTISKYFNNDSATQQQGGAGQSLQDVALNAGGDFLKDQVGSVLGAGSTQPSVVNTAAMENIGAQGTGSLSAMGAGGAIGGALGAKYFGSLIGKEGPGTQMMGGILGSVGGAAAGSLLTGGTAAAGAAVGGAAIPAAAVAIFAGNIMAGIKKDKLGRKMFRSLADDDAVKMGQSDAGVEGAMFTDPISGKQAYMAPESFEVLERLRSGEQKRGGKQGFLLSDTGGGKGGLWHPTAGIMDADQLAENDAQRALERAVEKGGPLSDKFAGLGGQFGGQISASLQTRIDTHRAQNTPEAQGWYDAGDVGN